MSRIVKIVILAGLLIAVSYLLGTICWRMQWGYELTFTSSLKAASLIGWCLMGTLLVTISASLVAALVRPLWACGVTFLLASLALLLGWEVRVGTGLVALLYLLALLLYGVKTAKELQARGKPCCSPSKGTYTRGNPLLNRHLSELDISTQNGFGSAMRKSLRQIGLLPHWLSM